MLSLSTVNDKIEIGNNCARMRLRITFGMRLEPILKEIGFV